MDLKILTLSDLHHEFYRDQGLAIPDIESSEDFDVIVLSGDIDSAENAAHWAVRQSEIWDKPVILVPGNHEFYGQTVSDALFEMREITKGTQVKLMHDDYQVINGVLFIGATLWTAQDQENVEILQEKMTDYHEIEVDEGIDCRLLTPEDTLQMHYNSVNFIESMLEREFTDSVVVVTHHAPHPNSLTEHYKSRKLQAGYASDLSYIMKAHKIDLWIHGHTHDKVDYEVHGTRIFNNARGYLKDTIENYQGAVVSVKVPEPEHLDVERKDTPKIAATSLKRTVSLL